MLCASVCDLYFDLQCRFSVGGLEQKGAARRCELLLSAAVAAVLFTSSPGFTVAHPNQTYILMVGRLGLHLPARRPGNMRSSLFLTQPPRSSRGPDVPVTRRSDSATRRGGRTPWKSFLLLIPPLPSSSSPRCLFVSRPLKRDGP